MDSETIYEVVKKLVGPIDAYGSTEIDEQRLKNLEVFGDLLVELKMDLRAVSQNKTRQEYSMKQIGEKAQYYIDELKEH